MKQLLLILHLTLSIQLAFAQAYKNPNLLVEERVKDLLSRMSKEEKFWQLFMIPGDLGEDQEKYKARYFWLPGEYGRPERGCKRANARIQ
jgi:beta-glucosidase